MKILYGGDNHVYPPAEKCIYCGTTDGPLSREHIVPFALNGNWILPKASCSECAKKTQKIEEVCTHERWGMFHPLRTRLNMQTRRGRERHKQLPVVVRKPDGSQEIVKMQSAGFPAVAFGMVLPPAGILLGIEPSNTTNCKMVFGMMAPEGSSEIFANHLEGCAIRVISFNYTAFIQLLAKIGYSYAAAELGTESLLTLLPEIILGKTDVSPYLVGGGSIDCEGRNKGICLHRLELMETTIRDQRFTLVIVRLFEQLGLPEYHVVVRQRPLN